MLKIAAAALVLSATAALADAPDVQHIQILPYDDVWKFTVTITHDDKGWEDYAEAWRIIDDQGNVFGKRNLLHPHEGYPSVTRSLSRVQIPTGVREVNIQTYDTLGGWSPKMTRVSLP